jgi:hypothetical protein
VEPPTPSEPPLDPLEPRSGSQVETTKWSLTLLPFGPVVSSLFLVRKLAGKIPEKFSGVPKESVDISKRSEASHNIQYTIDITHYCFFIYNSTDAVVFRGIFRIFISIRI